MSDFAGQTVLITGAGAGIGQAAALRFAALHARVAVNSFTERHAEETVRRIRNAGGIAMSAAGDVSDEKSAERIVSEVCRAFGGVDVLVNNAGVSYIGLLQEMSVSEWQQVMNTNLNSLFYTSRLAIPHMLQRKSGKIINISSVWGNCGASMEVAYSASKGGVNSFTRALARELAPSNIQVNAIACGVIDTAMNGCFSPEEMDALREEIPADRIGKPAEVAQLVCSLLQAPSYLTGQIITLDGGWT